jgi:uncharacterized protein YecE (DUF72 family)
MLRLRKTEKALANFFASGLLQLGSKLGPLLWQLPPDMKYDAEVMEEFLRLLPGDTDAALGLARRRERSRMAGRSSLRAPTRHRLRHALEVRHASFCTPAFVRQLRRHRIALVVADTAGRFPYAEDVTADFLYLRLHGDAELYVSGYSGQALGRWSRRILAWSRGGEPPDAQKISALKPTARKSRDVYCYFDNDAKVHAPFDAIALWRKLEAALRRQGQE